MIGRQRPQTGASHGGSGQRRLVLEALNRVAAGYVATIDAVAAHAGISAAEVVTYLSQLTEDERQLVPWHRVVAKGGAIGRGPWRERQFALLIREGLSVSPAGIVQDMAKRAISDLAAPPLSPPPACPSPGSSRSRGMKDRP